MPAQEPRQVPAMQPTTQELATQDHMMDQQRQPVRASAQTENKKPRHSAQTAEPKFDTAESAKARPSSSSKIVRGQNVEIVDKQGVSLGEFDEIQATRFIEDKSARGLGTVNPRTNRAHQTTSEWAQRQIFEKTVVRIENLQHKAVATRATAPGEIPHLDQIVKIRSLHFRIEAANSELFQAVDAELRNLRTRFPEWHFTVEYK